MGMILLVYPVSSDLSTLFVHSLSCHFYFQWVSGLVLGPGFSKAWLHFLRGHLTGPLLTRLDYSLSHSHLVVPQCSSLQVCINTIVIAPLDV